MTSLSKTLWTTAVEDAEQTLPQHTQLQQPANRARDIDIEIAMTSIKIQLIEFLMAQQKSITYASGAINEAKRQNVFRKQGLDNVTEEWFDAAVKEVDMWLVQMKSTIQTVEEAGCERK